MSKIENTYGVFTLERQDLVDLSRRIAQCIPAEFLKDRYNPVIIAVDGSYNCGKKIVADYGREAFLGINHDDVRIPKEFDTVEIIADPLSFYERVKNICSKLLGFPKVEDDAPKFDFVKEYNAVSNGIDIRCRGKVEFDEYVSAEINGTPLEVSFINIGWRGDFSFEEKIDLWTDQALLDIHLCERQAGGIAYVHNLTKDVAVPDIQIILESGSGMEHVNGEKRFCGNVGHALENMIGEDHAGHFGLWSRFVTVKFNNLALAQQADMVNMLKNEFGFCALDNISSDLLSRPDEEDSDASPALVRLDPESFASNSFPQDEVDRSGVIQAAVNLDSFPLARKHKEYLAALRNNPDAVTKVTVACPCP